MTRTITVTIMKNPISKQQQAWKINISEEGRVPRIDARQIADLPIYIRTSLPDVKYSVSSLRAVLAAINTLLDNSTNYLIDVVEARTILAAEFDGSKRPDGEEGDDTDTIPVPAARRLLAGRRDLQIVDVSGTSSYGYSYALHKCRRVDGPIPFWEPVGEPLALTYDRWLPDVKNKAGRPGAYQAVFSRAAIEAHHE